MSIKFLREEDFNLYLKILSQESVKKAYRDEILTSSKNKLFEATGDPLFGDDEEDDVQSDDEDEGGGDDGLDLDAAPNDKSSDDRGDNDDREAEAEPESEQKKQQVNIRPIPLTLELGKITSDGLISTLNMIRAGRSFKDPDISSQLKKYFEDQLSDSERLALATFLSALKDLSSGTPAEDASEPGDEDINISSSQGDDQYQEKQGSEQQSQQRPQNVNIQQSPKMSRGSEDTTAPIQVGRNNRISEEYRKYILSILV